MNYLNLEKEQKLKKKKCLADRSMVDSNDRPFESGIHQAINPDIVNAFRGKTHEELEKLQEQIMSKINSGSALDVEYWETILKRLAVQKAKAQLREIHAQLLKTKLAQLQSQKENEEKGLETNGEKFIEEKKDKKLSVQNSEFHSRNDIDKSEEEFENKYEEARKKQQYEENQEENQEAGSLSPEIIHNYGDDEEVVDEETDLELLNQQRKEILEKGARKLQERSLAIRPSDKLLTEEDMFKREAESVMEENEEPFNMEIPLENQVYWWHDKYRPRKPRYFNRIHTGYEWNKYNQTHYDHDNPPPKIVQGYKFNIFLS